MSRVYAALGIFIACLLSFWVGVHCGSPVRDCLVFDAANGTAHLAAGEITFRMRCLGDTRAYDQTIPLVRVQR